MSSCLRGCLPGIEELCHDQIEEFPSLIMTLIGNSDGTAQLWPVDVYDDVAFFCSLLQRDLTPDERAAAGIHDETPTCPQFSPDSKAQSQSAS